LRVTRYIRQHHIGLIALFIALTGTAYAGTQVANRPADSQAVKAKKKKVKRGPAGPQGPAGATGAKGPGATSFTSTVPVTPTGLYEPLTTINGLTIEGACSSNSHVVSLRISTPGSTSTLQITGTTFNGTSLQPFDFDGTSGSTNTGSADRIDLDAIARDSAVSSAFTRVDLHVQTNGSAPCPVWGMFTPSS
jgi:hypothetical protein